MSANGATKRPRGRPRVHIPVAAASSPAAAVAALEQADARELELLSEAPAATPDDSRGDGINPLNNRSPSSASASPSLPPRGPGRPPASDVDRTIPLSGKRYKDLNRDQLRTALAIADNERAELRAQLAKATPIASAATDDMLQRACGETFGAICNALAMKFGDEIRLADKDRDALGRVWAAPVAQLLRDHPDAAAKYAPLLAALTVTAGIGLEKVAIIRRRRVLERAETAVT